MYINMYKHVCMHARTHMHLHIYLYVYVHAYIHIHMHTSEFSGAVKMGHRIRFGCGAMRCVAKLCVPARRRDSAGWCFQWAVAVQTRAVPQSCPCVGTIRFCVLQYQIINSKLVIRKYTNYLSAARWFYRCENMCIYIYTCTYTGTYKQSSRTKH